MKASDNGGIPTAVLSVVGGWQLTQLAMDPKQQRFRDLLGVLGTGTEVGYLEPFGAFSLKETALRKQLLCLSSDPSLKGSPTSLPLETVGSGSQHEQGDQRQLRPKQAADLEDEKITTSSSSTTETPSSWTPRRCASLFEQQKFQETVIVGVVPRWDGDDVMSLISAGFTRRFVEDPSLLACYSELLQLEFGEIIHWVNIKTRGKGVLPHEPAKVIDIISAVQEDRSVPVTEALDRVREILRTSELYSPQFGAKEEDPHTKDLIGGLMSTCIKFRALTHLRVPSQYPTEDS
ncbi:High affinity cAMP-specific and IBMX-insensitive 3',5'-cyclic phosphodiesterase 8A [Myotis davidii]|uniref:High affinity cAMP-specific and IBMX-insensitive 3',5'-cyclic phosphodiesterase 8A n=1 Tax=Myotis davidii TaxID=225400 RepID=L5MDY3_MYODS|nr:High affinity cAMP-specific and IBMX-insensitive 3',5'-cyclic phosphodiesterase 8A [Myotis davidii]